MNFQTVKNILTIFGLLFASANAMTIDYDTASRAVDRCYNDVRSLAFGLLLFVLVQSV
jgi:hypothetical protein